MEKIELINKKFLKKDLILTIAKYQIYYQMALGVLVKETCFDKNEIEKKLKQLQLDIDVENILNVMIELIDSFYNDDEFDIIFEDNIKVNAFLHCLKDFIEKNDDLTNKEKVHTSYKEKIMNDAFFDAKMQLHFDDELKHRVTYWEELITEKIADEIKHSALGMVKGKKS